MVKLLVALRQKRRLPVAPNKMVHDNGSGMFPLIPIPVNNDGYHKPIKNRCRRLQQRIARSAAVINTTNRIITSLNHLAYSLPSAVNTPSILTAASLSSPASVPMTAAKDALVEHCYNSALRYHRRTSSVMDGDSSDDSQRTLDHQSSTIGYSKSITAVPIVASPVSLPDQAGAVDTMASLPPHIMNYYRDGSSCIRKDSSSTTYSHTKPLTKPRFFGARTEQVALYKRMERAGMIDYTITQPLVVNGIFAVPKGNKQRLIIDGR